jgi:hypothetical protein
VRLAWLLFAAQNMGTIWAPMAIYTPPQQAQKETPQFHLFI